MWGTIRQWSDPRQLDEGGATAILALIVTTLGALGSVIILTLA